MLISPQGHKNRKGNDNRDVYCGKTVDSKLNSNNNLTKCDHLCQPTV